jgi:hypothetical protein
MSKYMGPWISLQPCSNPKVERDDSNPKVKSLRGSRFSDFEVVWWCHFADKQKVDECFNKLKDYNPTINELTIEIKIPLGKINDHTAADLEFYSKVNRHFEEEINLKLA